MSSVITLAFEPVVPQLIDTTVDRLFVVPAAVSDESGITTMKVENANGGSSSLSSVDHRARAWGDGGDRVPARVVPVVTMQSVMASLPASLTVWYLKTDTQGFDTRILKAAGDALPRIHYVRPPRLNARAQLFQPAVTPFHSPPNRTKDPVPRSPPPFSPAADLRRGVLPGRHCVPRRRQRLLPRPVAVHDVSRVRAGWPQRASMGDR